LGGCAEAATDTITAANGIKILRGNTAKLYQDRSAKPSTGAVGSRRKSLAERGFFDTPRRGNLVHR
jgi:hypothetical protein